MRIIAIIFFVISYQTICRSQNLKKFILDNTQEIKSINPNDTDYSDLGPLKKAIGKSRVVMLGEQSHGDATTFEAKTKIIKMLHEEMGFDVLVFESDFYGMHQCNKHLDSLGFTTLKNNIFEIWTGCKQMNDIFEYCENNDSLIMTGCDSRHSGLYTKANYVTDFAQMLKSSEIPFYKNEFKKFKPILTEIIKKEYQSTATEEDKMYFKNSLDSISVQLKKVDIEDKSFWIQELRNLKMYAKFAWKNGPNSIQQVATDGRDYQMGENLIWLATKMYPNKKIIFWGHNGHIMKNPVSYKRNYAGHVFVNNSNISTYVLGFDSYEGEFKFIGMSQYNDTINDVKKRSIEAWFSRSKYPYALVDFSNFEGKSKPTYMRGKNHFYSKYHWHKNFDGIFYIEKMQGCEPNN